MATKTVVFKMAVECMECGKRFKTTSTMPECPGCGGSDVDLARPVRTSVEAAFADLASELSERPCTEEERKRECGE